MASSGPRYPTAAVNESVAPENTDAWVNPTNVGADDTAEAVITAATFDSPDISQRLNTSGYGFAIPSGSTIDGIVVEIMRRNSAGAASDNRVQLRDAAGALVGDNKADTALDWPTAEALKTYGSAIDLWNATPTVAMVNDADFGVTLSVQADAANTDIQVDFIRVTISYTAPVIVALAGVSAGVSTVVGALAVKHSLAGASAGVCTVSGALSVRHSLAGVSAGAATVSGSLTVTADGGGDGGSGGTLSILYRRRR